MLLGFQPFAGPRSRVTGPLLRVLAVLLVAACTTAHADPACDGHAAVPGGGAGAPGTACDAAHLVGPPAPLGLLFAPAMQPGTGGLRYEIEAPPGPAVHAAGLVPTGGGMPRMFWDPDVQSQLREIPAPGGGFVVHLLGAHLDLAMVTIADDGRVVLGCAQQPATPAARVRAGRE